MRPTTGITKSSTSELTILPKAAPMITPTARATTLALTANARNSEAVLIEDPSGSGVRCPVAISVRGRVGVNLGLFGRRASGGGANPLKWRAKIGPDPIYPYLLR